jgi:hypothetical protein
MLVIEIFSGKVVKRTGEIYGILMTLLNSTPTRYKCALILRLRSLHQYTLCPARYCKVEWVRLPSGSLTARLKRTGWAGLNSSRKLRLCDTYWATGADQNMAFMESIMDSSLVAGLLSEHILNFSC